MRSKVHTTVLWWSSYQKKKTYSLLYTCWRQTLQWVASLCPGRITKYDWYLTCSLRMISLTSQEDVPLDQWAFSTKRNWCWKMCLISRLRMKTTINYESLKSLAMTLRKFHSNTISIIFKTQTKVLLKTLAFYRIKKGLIFLTIKQQTNSVTLPEKFLAHKILSLMLTPSLSCMLNTRWRKSLK